VPDEILPPEQSLAQPQAREAAAQLSGTAVAVSGGLDARGVRTATAPSELKRAAELARQHAEDKATNLRTQMKSVIERKLKNLEAAPKQGVGGPQPPVEILAVDRVLAAVPTVTPLVVREYAAPRPGSADPEQAEADTLLWMPVIVLPEDGRTRLTVPLGSATGGYRVIVAGHTLDGRIGAIDGILPVAVPGQPVPTPPVPQPKNFEPNKP
jgi:hypothetical protein